MSDDMETPAHPRTSRFKEHTNTAGSIKPPPDELWKDLGIEDMIDKFNEESNAPPKWKSKSTMPPEFGVPATAAPVVSTSGEQAAPTMNEGTLGRFSRAWASVFGGFGSVLGKRKAGSADAEKERERQVLEARKQAADQAYQARKLAQEQGLLPTPKVFIRPTGTPRTHKCVVEHTPLSVTPRAPTLYKSPSKKDLQKQKKLTRRVSDLEHKLASARKELQTVLHKDVPPVPPLPVVLPPTPTPESSQPSQVFSDKENETSQDTKATSQDTQASSPVRSSKEILAPSPTRSQKSIGKIVKKRKATTDEADGTYIPIPTDSEGDIDMTSASEPDQHPQRTIKRVKSNTRKSKRSPARLTKRQSRANLHKEREVRVVPDGCNVPPLPQMPAGVKGKKVDVGDDGYGGLEHEMF